MKKSRRKLVLSKETLLGLDSSHMRGKVEGAYNTNPKETFSAYMCQKTEWYDCDRTNPCPIWV